MSTGRDLARLPKAHLHLHLDGALRPDTFVELATGAGVAPVMPAGYGSFAEFSATIAAAGQCLRSAADVTRVVDELVADAAAAGAVWVEPSVWPGLFAGRLGSDAHAVDVVLAAGRDAVARHGIGFGLVVAAGRDRGPEAALALADLAVSRRDTGVVGFGLDGDERAAPAALFGEAFGVAHAGGLLAVPHAGELSGPESVVAAIEVLGADRIMHGVTAADDPELLVRLASTPIALDVCPTSNVLLGVTPSLATHPLPGLLAAGVACSLNADDPLLFGTDLLAEYQLARTVLGLSDEELAECARTSLRHSGAPVELVDAALVGIGTWLAGPPPPVPRLGTPLRGRPGAPGSIRPRNRPGGPARHRPR